MYRILTVYYDMEANAAIAVIEKNTGEPDKLLHLWQGKTGLISAVKLAENDFLPDSIDICKAPEGIECPYAGALKAQGFSLQAVPRLQRVQVQATLELAKIETAGASERELEVIARAMESSELPATAYAVAMAIKYKKSFSHYWAISKPVSQNRREAMRRSANARAKRETP